VGETDDDDDGQAREKKSSGALKGGGGQQTRVVGGSASSGERFISLTISTHGNRLSTISSHDNEGKKEGTPLIRSIFPSLFVSVRRFRLHLLQPYSFSRLHQLRQLLRSFLPHLWLIALSRKRAGRCLLQSTFLLVVRNLQSNQLLPTLRLLLPGLSIRLRFCFHLRRNQLWRFRLHWRRRTRRTRTAVREVCRRTSTRRRPAEWSQQEDSAPRSEEISTGTT